MHITFIGIEVTKFLLWLFFRHVAEEFSFYILHCHISSLMKRCYNLRSTCYICVKTVLHFALKVFTLRVHVTSDVFKFRVNWRHNLRLFAPSRLTTCLSLENNKKRRGRNKNQLPYDWHSALQAEDVVQTSNVKWQLGERNHSKFHFIHQYFVYAQTSLSFRRRNSVYFLLRQGFFFSGKTICSW